MSEKRIRNVIMKLVDVHKERPRKGKRKKKWENERETHYEFFKLFIDEFGADEVKKNFRWEYPIKTPRYGKSKRPKLAAMDLAYLVGSDGFIGIEIEFVSAGKGFESEIGKCIEKFRETDYLGNKLCKGFIVPLIDVRERRNIRTDAGVISYKEYFDSHFAEFRAVIKKKNRPVEIITDGVLFRG